MARCMKLFFMVILLCKYTNAIPYFLCLSCLENIEWQYFFIYASSFFSSISFSSKFSVSFMVLEAPSSAAIISSEREVQGRLPNMRSTSSAKITSFSTKRRASLLCPSLCSDKIAFGTVILFVNHAFNFFINKFGCAIAIWFAERIFFITVIT